jgi:hypothetical protein
MLIRHCEKRSDEAIQNGAVAWDCFASLAMTIMKLVLAFACGVIGQAAAQEFSDPYSIMAPERVPARHDARKFPMQAHHLAPSGETAATKHSRHKPAVIDHGASGVVLPTPLPRTQLIPPEGRGTPTVQSAPPQPGATVLPGVNPIPNLPHGPETFQDRASRCAFQQQLYNVPGNLGAQYMGSCVQ